MEMPKHLAEALVDGQTYADFEKLHAVFAELRTTAPVALAKPDGIEPFWFISKFDDVQFVEKDNALFHAGDKSTVMITQEEQEIVVRETGGANRFITLVHMDGEKHAAYRELTQSWFGPRSLRELEPRIRERAKNAVETMLAMGTACDFARDVALYYPLRVIMDILGVENDDEDLMLRLTQEVFGSTDPEANATGRDYATTEERMAAMNGVVMESLAYFSALTESRRKDPKNDLATLFANGKVNGAPLGDIYLWLLCHYRHGGPRHHLKLHFRGHVGFMPTAGIARAVATRPLAHFALCGRKHSLGIAGQTFHANPRARRANARRRHQGA